MYQIKIENTVEKIRKVTVANGEQLINEDGSLQEEQKQILTPTQMEDVDGNPEFDENGDPVMYDLHVDEIDENGDPVMKPILNDTGSDSIIAVNKTAEEIAAEEDTIKDAKLAEVMVKMNTYQAAQAHQLANGGPGPVADFDTMKICNEHNCEFEVVFREE